MTECVRENPLRKLQNTKSVIDRNQEFGKNKRIKEKRRAIARIKMFETSGKKRKPVEKFRKATQKMIEVPNIKAATPYMSEDVLDQNLAYHMHVETGIISVNRIYYSLEPASSQLQPGS